MRPSDDAAPQLLRAGRCLCGRLSYRVKGAPLAVNACHCRDCQRLSGSAFAVNAMFETRALEKTGPNWDARDQAGDAPGTRSWRCADCGVRLFGEHPLFQDTMRFVRVGTLDDARDLEPDAHYFVRSKHGWVTIPDGIPAYETLPDR